MNLTSDSTLLRAIGNDLQLASRIVLASHARPDGDAIGSVLGLGLVLEALGKEVFLLNEDPVPHRYRFLPASDRIRQPAAFTNPIHPDVFIALDTANRARIGDSVWKIAGNPGRVFNLDHHITNEGYGDVTYIDPSSPAAGQIVCRLVELMDWPMPDPARDALWAALVTDTGSFQYSGTSVETLEIAAGLMRRGLDPGPISTALFQSYPLRRLLLLGELLSHLRLSSNGLVASWKLPRSTIDRLQIDPEDHDGLIDHLRAIEGVIVAVSFEELPEGAIRISARSKDAGRADVSELCARFGGGGHRAAAGARVEGRLDDVAAQFLSTLEAQLNHG